jgi:adenylate cyclase class IV
MELPVPPELELKAVIPDPDALRKRLLAAGAEERFRGHMSDRRYDREGELRRRDQVLRVRCYRPVDGGVEWVLGWKGRKRRARGGYKMREEIELPIAGGESPEAFLDALGYEVVHAIDREIEVYALAGATLRFERYPRMDPLIEVEGPPDAIERAIRATGMARSTVTADSLAAFARRYKARTGKRAILADES